MAIQRYEPNNDERMNPWPSGEWVRHTDHAAIVERLVGALEKLTLPWMEPKREKYALWSGWKAAHDAYTEARAVLAEVRK